MKYFVFFDAYGHAKQVVSENELAEKYNNDPDEFLMAVSSRQADAEMQHSTGHIGTLSFSDEDELKEFLESLGDEISGFYNGDGDSRPYNF